MPVREREVTEDVIIKEEPLSSGDEEEMVSGEGQVIDTYQERVIDIMKSR